MAARYFVMDKQNEWRQDLAKMKEKKLLGDMITDAERLKLSKKDDVKAFFTIANEKNIVEVQVILRRNKTNKWKIQDM